MRVSIRASMRLARGSDAHPLEWAFEQGSKLGFDGLELCMPASARPVGMAGQWSDETIAGVKGLCGKHNMPIYSLSSDWAWAYAAFFPGLREWGKGVELIADDARLAKALDAHTILVHLATSKGSWEDCRALLKDVGAAGAESGVRLGYEANIWERLGFGGLDSLCRMVDEVGSPYFGVYLHNAYPRAGLSLHEEIKVSGERLVQAMHSSSLTSGVVQIDYQQAFAAMKEYFADGVYTFEVPWEEAEENKRVLDQMLAKYG